jgi:iron complex outermembrane receptor protein
MEGVWTERFGNHLTLNASGFYNHIGSYIEQQTIVVHGMDQTTFFNSKATAKGAELEAVGKLGSGFEGRLSYTYQDARNDLSGAPLPDSPKHLVKLNVAEPLFWRAVTPAIEAEYMSRSSTLWPSTSDSAPPVLVNASLSTGQLWRGFSLSASAYNLVGRSMSEPAIGYFEQTHTVPSSSLLPEDRRSFRFKLTWSPGESSSKASSNTQETH